MTSSALPESIPLAKLLAAASKGKRRSVTIDTDFVAAIIAARDAQWAALVGHPALPRLSNEDCDKAATLTIERVGAAHGLLWNEVGTDIAVHETLRRELIRAGHALAGTAQAGARADQAAGLAVSQEPKYTVDGSAIVNRASGEAIPADEPVFIFRARDVHAREALGAYACVLTPGDHRDAVAERVADFAKFSYAHPARMKEPDTAATPASAAPPESLLQPAEALAALRGFAKGVMEAWPHGDLDGATLEAQAIKHGLLTPETRTEPCGESCNCAGSVLADEWAAGVTCYRKTPLLTDRAP